MSCKLRYLFNFFGAAASCRAGRVGSACAAVVGSRARHHDEALPRVPYAPMEQRREYQKAIEAVLADPKGHVIAQRIGCARPDVLGCRRLRGSRQPGAHAQVEGDVTDEDIKELNASEALRALLLRQDAFAWHKPQLLPNGKSDPYLILCPKTHAGIVHPMKVGEPLTHKDAFDANASRTGRVFSAGLDFDYHFPLFARRSIKEFDAWFEIYRATNLRTFTYPRPTVAAINGHTYAGGLITALDCDMRIAAEGDLQFVLSTRFQSASPCLRSIARSSSTRSALYGRLRLLFSIVFTISPPLSAWALSIGSSHPSASSMKRPLGPALSSPDCHPAYAFSKRALQAATLRAIDDARRLDLDLLSRGMTDPGSLRAQARRYRELKAETRPWEINSSAHG